MNITILLPCTMERPVGGIKVILEYANRFVSDGHDVKIIMPSRLMSIKNKLASVVRFPYYMISRNYFPYKWFPLDKKICCLYVKNLKYKYMPQNTDVFIATAVETAYFLNSYDTQARKIYFIQDFEDWSMNKKQVLKSYGFHMEKIVISPWLKKLVESVGEKAYLIPNGFDFKKFYLKNSIEDRNNHKILMLYHKEERKRCKDAIKALRIVKKEIPDLSISMFGVPKKPKFVPFDFNYYQKPNSELHNDLYNNAEIFIAASRKEGMALPPAEAMQCGCAVCCTDIGGFAVYAKDNNTALLSPVYDYRSLAMNIIKLLQNENERIRIAMNGNKLIQEFTWDNAFEKFKKILFAGTL